jgi:methylated-DNA-[protein]-cysteine S-methyltransferase
MGKHAKTGKMPGKPGCRTPSSFRAKVFKIVSSIPAGKMLTYSEVAKRAGRPKAQRAVGNILAKNFDPKIPCHRVIRSDGKIGGYNRGRKLKINKLKEEKAL